MRRIVQIPADRQGRHRHHRGQQQIVAFVELAHPDAEGGARHIGAEIFDRTDALAERRHRDEAGVAQIPLLGRETGQHAGFPGGPQGQQRIARRWENLADFLDRSAELFELPCGGSACRGDLGIDAGIAEIGAVGDAQPAHPILDAVAPVVLLRGQRIRIAVIRPVQHVQQQCRIAHIPRHRPDIRQQPKRRGRIGRDPAKTRLDAENAGEGGGDADRAGAVAADMQRRNAGGAGRGRAGAAASRCVLQIPRVAGHAGQRAVADRLPAEFRGRGLAENDRAGLAQARHCRRVLRPILRRIDQL